MNNNNKRLMLWFGPMSPKGSFVKGLVPKMEPLRGGGTFEKWSLERGPEVNGGMLWKGFVWPHAFSASQSFSMSDVSSL